MREVSNRIYGRCLWIKEDTVGIQSTQGEKKIFVENPEAVSAGDIVEADRLVDQDDRYKLRRLTPNRSAQRSIHWLKHVSDSRRVKAVGVRARVEAGIRDFFQAQGFLETRTPLLVQCPGMEPHIRTFKTDGGAYLPTSPEFAMKRLLVGGLEKIFQLCPAFRAEPFSTTHFPEFTMLEWYRAYSGYEDIMSDVEAMLEKLAMEIHGEPVIRFQGKAISVKRPWPRLRVRDLFREVCGVDLVQSNTREKLAAECSRLGIQTGGEDTWDDIYFRIWLNLIEPKLPENQAVFVTRYPASQAALAVVDSDPDGSRWARRFEVYAGGIELGNAFEELTDPAEQRARFVKDMQLREDTYGASFPKNALDEEFLGALEEGMPPAGGIAIGVDRMVMLFADEPDIEKTFWLSPYYRE